MATNVGEFHNSDCGRVFVKIVKPKHYYRNYGGYALDWDALSRMPDQQTILLKVKGDEGAFVATAADFRKYGKQINFAGFGLQTVLSMGRWKVVGDDYFRCVMGKG